MNSVLWGVVLLVCAVTARDFVVIPNGGADPVDGWKTGSVFRDYRVRTGDRLVFRWKGAAADHTVLKANANVACGNAAFVAVPGAPATLNYNGVAYFETSYTFVAADVAGDYWFTSNTAADCPAAANGNLRLKATVVAVAAVACPAVGINQLSAANINVAAPAGDIAPTLAVAEFICLNLANAVDCPAADLAKLCPAVGVQTYAVRGTLKCSDGSVDDGLLSCRPTFCPASVQNAQSVVVAQGSGNPGLVVGANCGGIGADGQTCRRTCVGSVASGLTTCTQGAWTFNAKCLLQCPVLTPGQIRDAITNTDLTANTAGCLETNAGDTCQAGAPAAAVALICAAGFRATDNIKCSATGNWVYPECAKLCVNQPDRADKSVALGAEDCKNKASGESCTVVCEAGYTKNSDYYCLNGLWSKPLCLLNPVSTAVCTKKFPVVNWGVPNCDDLVEPAIPGAVCPVICASGYIATGPYVCTNGAWVPPQCQLYDTNAAVAHSVLVPLMAVLVACLAFLL